MENRWAESPEPKRDSTFEQALLGIKGVRRAGVHLDLDGGIMVRVLVVPESNVERTIEEVKQVAAARGVEVPASSIEILGGDKEASGVRRRCFSSLTMKREDEVFQAQVSLRRSGDALIGESSAPNLETTTLRAELLTVSDAVIDALRIFFGAGAEVQEVRVVELGDQQVCLSLVKVGEEHFVGSALVRRGEHDAVVRATLDAVNRPLVSPWDNAQHPV